ncbi:MAG: hypothetical protein QHH06_08660 [Clostridiales bacterium]|jgi:hypothetical protein|nr:hypothetical protein [Eubacteriales bacterium]MDH7566538.1 hypothetical protein [Clostridiales bacterium]
MGNKGRNQEKKTARGIEPRIDNDQLGENASGEGTKGGNCPTGKGTARGRK